MWLKLLIGLGICALVLRPLRVAVLKHASFTVPAFAGALLGLALAKFALANGITYQWLTPAWMVMGAGLAGEAVHLWIRGLNK